MTRDRARCTTSPRAPNTSSRSPAVSTKSYQRGFSAAAAPRVARDWRCTVTTEGAWELEALPAITRTCCGGIAREKSNETERRSPGSAQPLEGRGVGYRASHRGDSSRWVGEADLHRALRGAAA